MAFFAGFDAKNYPGNDTMNWLATNTNLRWCGYYLAPAPNRPPSGWQGQYASLKAQWGVLPIYVGQQDPNTGNTNYNPSSILTADQGTIDGKNAADLASADQFPSGTFVYLDWEEGDLNTGGAKDYIRSWIAAVAASGQIMPGIYCSHAIASDVAALVDQINPTPIVKFWCWKVSNPTTPHPYHGDLMNIPLLDPSGCGVVGADAWQREDNVVLALGDGAPVTTLQVDFSSASSANPGAPIQPVA